MSSGLPQQPAPPPPPAPVPVVQTTGATAIEITKIVLGAMTPIMLAWVGLKQPTEPAAPTKPTVIERLDSLEKHIDDRFDALKPVKKI